MKATIYHNSKCSKSREALALLQEAGADVTIVEYLKTPPSRAELVRLYDRAGMTPRQGLRMAEDGAKAVKHGDTEAILDAMMIDPLLIERPLVETDKGVRLGRPIARLHEIL
ncbi:arsenate reductase family protein [Sphingomonas sp. PvP018]|uniref:arsenate reductase family protein n=1 Tax=Sphingomonas sp. PvP018 TaxID=2817852 RepID=UPI001AE4575F|nr:arsenate reductase [Sphingomonas sp. PvP018]